MLDCTRLLGAPPLPPSPSPAQPVSSPPGRSLGHPLARGLPPAQFLPFLLPLAYGLQMCGPRRAVGDHGAGCAVEVSACDERPNAGSIRVLAAALEDSQGKPLNRSDRPGGEECVTCLCEDRRLKDEYESLRRSPCFHKGQIRRPAAGTLRLAAARRLRGRGARRGPAGAAHGAEAGPRGRPGAAFCDVTRPARALCDVYELVLVYAVVS